MKRFALIFVVLGMCFSCEREIQLDLFVEKPIVYASLHPDSLFTVWISQTSPPNNPFQTNPAVDNAEISVYEDGQLIHILPFMPHTTMEDLGGSFYGIERFYPKEGAEYELEINAPGMLPAYSKGYIPAQPDIPSFRILGTEKIKPSESSDLEVYRLEIDIELEHEPGTNEYFQLIAYSSIQNFQLNGTDTIKISSNTQRIHDLSEIEPSLSNIQVIRNLENQGILFSDENLEDAPIRLRFFVEYDLYTNTELKSPIFFSLQKHQKDEFLFRSSIQSIGAENGNTFQYFSDPDVIYTNVANGVGIFSGFNSRNITVFF
ncbi:MAG: DUF4249 domain-containing protein [Saprospiraceae bacterium]|nr:DUF4249 domain-containing protein [Saprospiraceae bacterium]